MKKLGFLFVILGIKLAIAAPAESGTLSTSNNFFVYPIQIILTAPGKIATMKISNTSKAPLSIQANLKQYLQYSQNGKLIESMPDVKLSNTTDKPAVIVTPIILQNIPGNQEQILRILGIKQNPDTEIVYRLSLKSLTPANINSSGTIFEIGYTVPIFILPKNVNQNYNIAYLKVNNKAYFKLTNTGNVHISFQNLTLNGVSLKLDQSRLLAGSTELVEIPNSIAKIFISGKSVDVKVTTGKLVEYYQNVYENKTVTIQ